MSIVRPKNFHLPLPEEIQTRLRAAAEREGVPATAVARRALDEWLSQCERSARSKQIAEYAAAIAGSRDDLDPLVEAASIEAWLKAERRTR